MNFNEGFEKLFEECSIIKSDEEQLSLPIYCGGSIIKDVDEDKIYSINLHKFINWGADKLLSSGQAQYIRSFIAEKISNGTLYTPSSMFNYPLTKRFQLFINSNIAEHFICDILDGTLLEGNDELTVNSTAVIGDDGCAAADTVIDGIDVEVKVTKNAGTRDLVLAKAHKKPVVAIYIISPDTSSHWEFYVRGANGTYALADFIIGHNYLNSDETDTYDKDLANKAIYWQSEMKIKAPKLPLLYFKDLDDGSLEITSMQQR